MALTAAQFVSDLGGNVGQVIRAVYDGMRYLTQSNPGTDPGRGEKAVCRALAFRDSQANHDRAAIIHRPGPISTRHFSDPNLSLNEVAAQVNFSPNHFSAVFSDETGDTFRDYLTRTRLEQAKNC